MKKKLLIILSALTFLILTIFFLTNANRNFTKINSYKYELRFEKNGQKYLVDKEHFVGKKEFILFRFFNIDNHQNIHLIEEFETCGRMSFKEDKMIFYMKNNLACEWYEKLGYSRSDRVKKIVYFSAETEEKKSSTK